MASKTPGLLRIRSIFPALPCTQSDSAQNRAWTGTCLTTSPLPTEACICAPEAGSRWREFFSSAFGNIFEAGILFFDPEFDLPANQPGNPIPFHVCGEETITAVAGWDRTDASLFLEITTPGGAIVTSATPAVESSSGRSWTFLRIKLPIAGERDGLWKVRVIRPRESGEIQPPAPAMRYFITVIPTRRNFSGLCALAMPGATTPAMLSTR